MDKNYILNEEESKRINILKFIAIIFVLYIHSYAITVDFSDGKGSLQLSDWLCTYEYYISEVISRCGVPLFFLISAVLFFLKERNYVDVLKVKFKTLLIPYLFWNSFWIAAWAVLQKLSFTAPFFSGNRTNIADCDFKEWLALYGIGSSTPQDYPLWFMRDLMVMFLIFPAIKMVLDKLPRLSLLIGVALTFAPDFPFKEVFSWFIVGGAIVKNNLHLSRIDALPFKLLAPIYVATSIMTLLFPNRIVQTLFIYLGIVFLIGLSRFIYENVKMRNVLLSLSQWTFIIYAFHELTLSSFKKVGIRFLPPSDLSWCLQYTLIPVLVVGICIAIGMIMSKLIPKFYVLVTGGR